MLTWFITSYAIGYGIRLITQRDPIIRWSIFEEYIDPQKARTLYFISYSHAPAIKSTSCALVAHVGRTCMEPCLWMAGGTLTQLEARLFKRIRLPEPRESSDVVMPPVARYLPGHWHAMLLPNKRINICNKSWPCTPVEPTPSLRSPRFRGRKGIFFDLGEGTIGGDFMDPV